MRRTEVRFVTGSVRPGGAGDHRYRVGQGGHRGLDQGPAPGVVGPLTGPTRHFERCVHIEVLGPGGGAPRVGQSDGGAGSVQRTERLGSQAGDQARGRGLGHWGHQRGLRSGWGCGRSAWEGWEADTDQGTLRLTAPHISVHNFLEAGAATANQVSSRDSAWEAGTDSL